MNILSIFYREKKGGYNTRLYMLYEALADAHHHLYYVSAERLSVHHRNIEPVILDISQGRPLLFWSAFMVKSLIKCLLLARKGRIDLIVTFGAFYTMLCALPVILYRIPAVTFLRADNAKQSTNTLRNAFFYVADWLGIKLSKKVLVVSSTLKQTYQERYGIAEGKIEVQPNNIRKKYTISDGQKTQIRKSLGVDPDEFLITTSGIFNEGKNFSFLIRALKRANQGKIKLLIIGDEVVPTGERKRLEELVVRLGLRNQVLLCGWQEDPARLIVCSDLYVYPSRYEGSPNALLEALGCQVPCLGSRIEEIAEVLTYGDLLFPLDDEQMLAESILKARNDPAYYEFLKRLSLKCGEKFCFDWGRETIKKMMPHKGRKWKTQKSM